eukprot:Partr_v1_DN26094_c0_g1_i1_m400 putative Second step of mRNA capping. Transfer of the GMP moiety of GTP to the 5'-end of RNA via an enzyme-GMP covalent reaction intermediate (By similarity)
MSRPAIPQAQALSADYEQHLRAKVSQFLPNARDRFPGAQPVSFVQSHLDTLKHENFFVSEKSDGTRYLLFIHCHPISPSTSVNGKDNKTAKTRRTHEQECFLIDRKNSYYHIPYTFPSSTAPGGDGLLDNTLLDGELVLDHYPNNVVKPRFLVFDLLILEGRDLTQRPFSKRLGYLNESVLKPLVSYQRSNAHDIQVMSVEMKKMELAYGMDRVWASVAELKHENDGLIFTSEQAPYALGTCEAMIKWKPPHLNSIDFKLRYTDDGKIMLDVGQGRGRYREHGEFTPPDASWIEKRSELDGKIVECTYDPNLATHWTFMRFREDKHEPNHESVVPKILQSIEEGVLVDQLMDSEYLANVKANWKARLQQKPR